MLKVTLGENGKRAIAMKSISEIELHAYQARSAFAHHIAKALQAAGLGNQDEGMNYRIAAEASVKNMADLLTGWLGFNPDGGDYYQDQLVARHVGVRHFFYTEATVERELNADSAFEMTVGRSSGYMLTIELPASGERVFVSAYAHESEKAGVTQWCKYNGGIRVKIAAQHGSWVSIDGDGDPDTFTPIGQEPIKYRVGHGIRVGERVTV